MNDLSTAAHAYRILREQLLERMPSLADDEDCLLDTLEGMTTIHEQLTELVRSALRDEAFVEGLTQYQVKLAERRAALKARAEQKRRAVTHFMEDLGLKRLAAPDLNVTRRAVAPSVVIFDPASIPENFVRVTVTREPDKTAIKQALKDGQAVAGAALSNGGETISVKV
jgi:hypothetical protein